MALDDVEVIGPGAGQVTVAQTAVGSRVFYAPSVAGEVSISGLTITGGNVGGQGGGVFSFGQDLSLDRVLVTGNSASNKGGGVAVRDAGATIRDSTVSGNTSSNKGGGISFYNGPGWVIERSVVSGNSAGSRGGGVFMYRAATGPVRIVDSTLSGNTSGNRGGGAAFYKATPEIVGSTIAGNTSTIRGGGLNFYKDTIAGTDTLHIADSTISGNQVTGGNGGGIFMYKIGRPIDVESTTIAGNSASTTGGGLDMFGAPAGTASVTNTILADNTAPAGPDFRDARPAGSVVFGFDLLETAPSGNAITESPAGSNLIGTDPQLLPLASNGGLTQTRALPPGSPAVNKGMSALATDQRGEARVVEYPGVANSSAPGANGADVGAFELQRCPTVSVSSYRPKLKGKRGRKAAGVRSRITVSEPSSLDVQASLVYREGGRERTADLGSRSLHAESYRNVRLVLPRALAKKLPVGRKVTLKLRITVTPDASPDCTSTLDERSLATKVRKILRAPQHFARP